MRCCAWGSRQICQSGETKAASLALKREDGKTWLLDARGKGYEAERDMFPLGLVKTSVGGFLGHDFKEFDFKH
jgi:hypothetical protein